MKFPPLHVIRQRFAAERLPDVRLAIAAELHNCGVTITPGSRIALAVGSRGIANLSLIVEAVAAWVRAQGGEPFIVPAMGSHGGATAEGQRSVLESYGITAAPILSSMDVVELGPDAFMDKLAFEADGTIVINRIKPHTSFHGRYESGLMKMIAVGLGNHAGAAAIHQQGVRGLRERMPEAAKLILSKANILLGLAVVENAHDETMIVRAIPAPRIPDEEPTLLETAKLNMPALPVDDIDLLVVDEIGKDISGTGLDTNVIGRLRISGEPEPAKPHIQMIVVRDLSAASGGSAYGIGLADVTTRRLVDKTNWPITYANVLTSGFYERGKLPLVAETDEQAVEWALRAPELPAEPRVVRIQNTLRLGTVLVSENIRKDIAGRNTIEVLRPACDFFELLTF